MNRCIFEALDLCRPLQRRPMDDDECIELQWIPLQEAYAMIRDGSITDAKTIIALQYAMLMKRSADFLILVCRILYYNEHRNNRS
ncbi:MAG: hypothetical protein ACLVJ6_08120 [Merdibacter sp.]